MSDLDMSIEIWKPIPDTDDYEVSNYGNVRFFNLREKRLTLASVLWDSKKGLQVSIRKNQKSTTRRSHKSLARIVYHAFIGATSGYIGFIDGNRMNCRADNLMPKRTYLLEKQHQHQRHQARLLRAMRILEDRRSGMSLSTIAKKHDVDISAVSRLVNGHRRPYLTKGE